MKVIPFPIFNIYKASTVTELPLPYFSNGHICGFPSPADDFLEDDLDFNRDFIRNPASTYFARVKGNSMQDAGINDGDILVVDKILEPKTGDIAVCYLDGEFTVKHILIQLDVIWLVPKNEDFDPIKVTEENDFVIWGIVINIIKSFR